MYTQYYFWCVFFLCPAHLTLPLISSLVTVFSGMEKYPQNVCFLSRLLLTVQDCIKNAALISCPLITAHIHTSAIFLCVRVAHPWCHRWCLCSRERILGSKCLARSKFGSSELLHQECFLTSANHDLTIHLFLIFTHRPMRLYVFCSACTWLSLWCHHWSWERIADGKCLARS